MAAHAPGQSPTKAPVSVPAPVQASVPNATAPAPAPVQAPTASSPHQRNSWLTQGLERTLYAPTPNESSPEMCKRSGSHGGQTRLPNQPTQCTQKSAESTQKRTSKFTTFISHQ